MLCHCGKPLHYTDKAIELLMKNITDQLGEFIVVTWENRKWAVQRHYIALHGLKAWELPDLGFKEILQNK